MSCSQIESFTGDATSHFSLACSRLSVVPFVFSSLARNYREPGIGLFQPREPNHSLNFQIIKSYFTWFDSQYWQQEIFGLSSSQLVCPQSWLFNILRMLVIWCGYQVPDQSQGRKHTHMRNNFEELALLNFAFLHNINCHCVCGVWTAST